MSTILQALQKSKFDQAGGPPPTMQPKSKLLNWKVAISLALFIIIALLSTLVYLLLNPRSEQQRPIRASSELVQAKTNNNLVKVAFDTKPLPVVVSAPVKATAIKVITPIKKVVAQKIITTNENQNEKKEEVLDDAPSSDLKRRFELALLLNDMEQDNELANDFTPEEGMNDGSDIHEMSSDFQDKVPLIRYDSHMYSSVVADRWIRINGEKLTEGEFDSTGQLELIEIQPQRSVFRLARQSFSVESLTDWKGY